MDLQEQGSRYALSFWILNCCTYEVPQGMMSAAASLGLSLLWDTDVGLSHVDRYTYSSEEYIKVSSGVKGIPFGSTLTIPRPGWCLPCYRYPKLRRTHRGGCRTCSIRRSHRKQVCASENRCYRRAWTCVCRLAARRPVFVAIADRR